MIKLPTTAQMLEACCTAGRTVTKRTIIAWRHGENQAPLWFGLAVADGCDGWTVEGISREITRRRDAWVERMKG